MHSMRRHCSGWTMWMMWERERMRVERKFLWLRRLQQLGGVNYFPFSMLIYPKLYDLYMCSAWPVLGVLHSIEPICIGHFRLETIGPYVGYADEICNLIATMILLDNAQFHTQFTKRTQKHQSFRMSFAWQRMLYASEYIPTDDETPISSIYRSNCTICVRVHARGMLLRHSHKLPSAFLPWIYSSEPQTHTSLANIYSILVICTLILPWWNWNSIIKSCKVSHAMHKEMHVLCGMSQFAWQI